MFFRKKKPQSSSSEGAFAKGSFSPQLLRELNTRFGVGEQISLRPEYIQELEVKSIVVGLMANQRLIYSSEDVSWDDTTQTIAFHSQDDGKSITRVEDFALLLPLENAGDRKMTYQRKEELSRVGLFKRGNTITVSSAGGGRRSYAIDGLVTRYMMLKEGLFANHEVAVLSLDPKSFQVSERRKHQRLLTDVPATIKAMKSERVFACKLVDFVEEAGRFVLDDPAAKVLLAVGKPVAVSIDMAELDRQYRLEGSVLKAQEDKLVVGFRTIHKEGSYTPFSKLDGIEIKAMLSKLSQSHPG